MAVFRQIGFAFPFRAVGVDAHIDPPETSDFYGNPMRIRTIFAFFAVGADDPVRPRKMSVFTEIQCEFATFWRADVGIGPYKQPR